MAWPNQRPKVYNYTDVQLHNYGLNRLTEREYLVEELRTKMLRMQPDPLKVDTAIKKLIAIGVLSEDRAIQSYFSRYGNRESIHKIKQRLLQKSADKELVAKYYDEQKIKQQQEQENEEGHVESEAYRLLLKKYKSYDIQSHQKMVRYLASRGCKYDEINKAINRLKS